MSVHYDALLKRTRKRSSVPLVIRAGTVFLKGLGRNLFSLHFVDKIKMKNKLWKASLRLFIALIAFPGSVFAIEGPIKVESGLLTGIELDSGVQAFLGIPFAKPPVGELRWKPPQAAEAWSGVKVADTKGPDCMTIARSESMSEDCLYLNIWSGAQSETDNLPVMVWIHGGGWQFKSTYDGDVLAENDVVVVSVNYRMNAFGWMAHPALSQESVNGVSGNYGVLDHLAALEWVQNNIENFGGDKNNVTIFGESAGGGSMYALLATQRSEGLFHKVISQSTWINSSNVTNLKTHNGFMDSAEDLGLRATESYIDDNLDYEQNLRRLRELTADEVLSLQVPVSLVVDGWLYPKPPFEVFREGQQIKVPIMSGYNDGEGIMYLPMLGVPGTVEEQRMRRESQFGANERDLINMYVAKDPSEIRATEVDYISDEMFVRASRELTLAAAKGGQDAFLYVFGRNMRQPENRASHYMEVKYVFNKLPESAPKEDVMLSRAMMAYWAQFARSGNPNRDGLPAWPAFNLTEQPHLRLDVEMAQGQNDRRERLDAMDAYYADKLTP